MASRKTRAARKTKKSPGDTRSSAGANADTKLKASRAVAAEAAYKRSMERDISKQHRAGKAAAVRAARAGKRFLACLADGDSWFNYQCGHSLLPIVGYRLESTGMGSMVNLAWSGQTLREMMTGDGLSRFTRHLRNGLVRAGDWDAVLISAGGDDVTNHGRFIDWIKPYDVSIANPASYVSAAFVDLELPALHARYQQAAELVHRLAPKALLFVHAYDFALPNGKDIQFGPLTVGPWLQPAFDARGFPRSPITLAWQVVKEILTRFESMLQDLGRQYPFVRVVPTQGTLGQNPQPRRWANELHPTDSSFEKLATVFLTAIENAFGE